MEHKFYSPSMQCLFKTELTNEGIISSEVVWRAGDSSKKELKMETKDRLKEWLDTVPQEKIKELALICIGYSIDSEYVNFFDDCKVPYWDCNGEPLYGKTCSVCEGDGELTSNELKLTGSCGHCMGTGVRTPQTK